MKLGNGIQVTTYYVGKNFLTDFSNLNFKTTKFKSKKNK